LQVLLNVGIPLQGGQDGEETLEREKTNQNTSAERTEFYKTEYFSPFLIGWGVRISKPLMRRGANQDYSCRAPIQLYWQLPPDLVITAQGKQHTWPTAHYVRTTPLHIVLSPLRAVCVSVDSLTIQRTSLLKRNTNAPLHGHTRTFLAAISWSSSPFWAVTMRRLDMDGKDRVQQRQKNARFWDFSPEPVSAQFPA